MNYEEFKKQLEAQREKSFNDFQTMFNEEMKKRGSKATLGSVLGEKPIDKSGLEAMREAVDMPSWDGEKIEQLVDLYLEIFKETADEDPRDIILRAMATYRHFVKHARAGGQVKFVKDGEKDRILKVKLR